MMAAGGQITGLVGDAGKGGVCGGGFEIPLFSVVVRPPSTLPRGAGSPLSASSARKVNVRNLDRPICACLH